jgi:hypothetical protein
VDFSQLAILVGCAMAIFGVVRTARHEESLRLIKRRSSIRELLENPDIRIVIIGVVIAAVGWLAAESN